MYFSIHHKYIYMNRLRNEPRKNNPWLNAWQSCSGTLNTTSSLLKLGFIHDNSDASAVYCDLKESTITVLSGNEKAWEHKLVECPSSVEFLQDPGNNEHLLAISAGKNFYIFRKLRPYLKYEASEDILCTGSLPVANSAGGTMVALGSYGSLTLLDASAVSIRQVFRVPSPVTSICCSGAFGRSYWIFASLMNGAVALIQENEMNYLPVKSGASVVCSCVLGSDILLATTCREVFCFSSKGVVNFVLSEFNDAVIAVVPVPSNDGIYLVGLKNGEIYMFSRSQKLSMVKVGNNLQGLTCGSFGREAIVLLAASDGNLSIKFLSRNFNLGNIITPPEIASVDIPKKTQTSVETSEREKREALVLASEIDNQFWNTKCRVLRDLVELKELGVIADNKSVPVSAEFKVIGLGPDFRLFVTLRTETDIDSNIILQVVNVIDNIYAVHTPPKQIKRLEAKKSTTYYYDLEVSEVEKANGEPVQVVLSSSGTAIFQKLVSMPISELPLPTL